MALDPNDQATIDAWGSEPLYISGNPQSTAPVSFDTGGPFAPDPGVGDSSGGVNATSIAKALNALGAGLKQAGGGDSSGAGSARSAPVGQAASGTGQGSASGMNALVQMLMQNQNKYFPGGPNTQPVAQGRQAGLLGF